MCFQAKWGPVRVKKTRQIKNLEPRFDSIETEKAHAPGLVRVAGISVQTPASETSSMDCSGGRAETRGYDAEICGLISALRSDRRTTW
jgi:hypothetical protein